MIESHWYMGRPEEFSTNLFSITKELNCVGDEADNGDLAYVQEQITAWEAAGVTMMVVGARSSEQIRDLAGLVTADG